jgi:DNA-binding response OmpR family regulator
MLQETHDILIVDDDRDIRYMMQSILKHEGYKTMTCASADELSDILSVIRPAAIIMDMLLSGTDGKDICRSLKKKESTNHIPVMMVSAHPDAELLCREAGTDDFLEKPFDIEVFISKIRSLIKEAVRNDRMLQDQKIE